MGCAKKSVGLQYLSAIVIVFASFTASASFELASEERRLVEGSLRTAEGSSLTETVWRKKVSPGGEFDVIGLHRFRNPEVETIAKLLYLPGTNMNGELSVRDEDHNLWLYLAGRGIEVYTLDYRTHAVSNDFDGSFEFMAEWGLSRFTDDAALAFEHVRSSSVPEFVAGFSRGVTFAYSLAGRVELDGMIVLDGSFKDFRARDFDRNAALDELHQNKRYASVLSRSRGWANRQELMRRVATDPDNAPLEDGFRTAGEQLSATLYNAWGPGGLANPKDGVSSISVLARLMEGYDRFYPAIQNIEGRALASYRDDPESHLDDHFGDMSVPVIYFGSTNLGPDHLLNGIYSASYSGTDDVTIHVLENFGHIDVLVANDARSLVYEPLLEWIRSRL